MKPEQHIVFLCSRLDLPGGIERGICNAANQLSANGFQVTLLVLDSTAATFYPLHSRVRLVQVPLHFGITEKGTVVLRKIAFVNHIWALRKQLTRLHADAVVGTEYVFTIAAKLALYRSGIKLFSWEHHHFYWLQKNRFWNFLLKSVYPKIDCIICLNATEEAIYKSLGCATTIIPYYVERAPTKAALNTKTILTIGWLIRRKGVDLIPEIAEAIFKKHPDWKWTIVGTGEEYGLLKKLIAEKKLEQNVEIVPPATSDLSAVYANAAIYAMLSRFEGLPFVLLEAMSFGVPCVAFDCLSGPADIITDKTDGFLIKLEDTKAVQAALLNLIEKDGLRQKMGNEAYQNITRFSPEVVLSLWKQVLQS